jgi:hypothetical protein
LLQRRLDVVRAGLSDRDKLFGIRRSTDAITQFSGWQVIPLAVSPILHIGVPEHQPPVDRLISLHHSQKREANPLRQRLPHVH